MVAFAAMGGRHNWHTAAQGQRGAASRSEPDLLPDAGARACVCMCVRIREFCVCDVSVRVTEARLAVESISKRVSVASAGVRVANLTLLTQVKIKQ